MHRLFLAVSFTLCVSAAAASYQSTRLVYTVSWGNILLAKSQLDYQFGKDDARISANVESDGFIAFFSGFQSRAKADLVLKDTGSVNLQIKSLRCAHNGHDFGPELAHIGGESGICDCVGNGLVTGQISKIGQGRMAAVEHAQFHLLKAADILYHLRACSHKIGALLIHKIISDHPLAKRLMQHWSAIM